MGQNIILVRHVTTMGVVQYTSTASHVAFNQIRYIDKSGYDFLIIKNKYCTMNINLQKEVLQDVLGKAAGTLNLLLTSVTDHFELCLTKCRTSSQSVQHENSYRNPRAKHCYGEAPPPLETEGLVETT